MKCPTCGTENEASNRFCDQCGSRIEPSGATAQAQVAGAAQPAATTICPACGAAVLPGEAFCDECGASLSGVAAAGGAASADAPTMFAPPQPDGGAAGASAPAALCPACGHQNLPGDDFCDNCGAALGVAPADGATVVSAASVVPQPQVPSDEDLLRSLNAVPPTTPAAPVEAPPATPPQAVEAPPAEPAPPEQVSAADQPTIEQTALPTQEEYQAERQRLEDEIARQQQIITQFEQMQAMFGAAVPPAVMQGLSEARSAQARVQTELDALQPPAPAIDPAEVARRNEEIAHLNEEIGRQQQIITQFEQMQAMFGAAAPTAVAQGLADARAAMASTEAQLAALSGPAAPSAIPAATPDAATVLAPTAGAPVAEAAPALRTAVTEAPPVPAPSAAPVAAPTPAVASGVAQMAAPHLLIEENGTELPLPTDKREIIIGREDPISGIFPEIDLTPYGGESGGVSRQHARINHDAGQWTVTDLNSTNYTRVDGTKIDPSVPVPIKDGARLQFGRVAVMFHE
jgi:uncharacterized OB-fold protein